MLHSDDSQRGRPGRRPRGPSRASGQDGRCFPATPTAPCTRCTACGRRPPRVRRAPRCAEPASTARLAAGPSRLVLRVATDGRCGCPPGPPGRRPGTSAESSGRTQRITSTDSPLRGRSCDAQASLEAGSPTAWAVRAAVQIAQTEERAHSSNGGTFSCCLFDLEEHLFSSGHLGHCGHVSVTAVWVSHVAHSAAHLVKAVHISQVGTASSLSRIGQSCPGRMLPDLDVGMSVNTVDPILQTQRLGHQC